MAASQRAENRKAIVAACAAFLSAVRQFRLFITVEAPEISLIEGQHLQHGFFAMVKGGREYQDAIQETGASLILLVGLDSPQFRAAEKAHKALWQLAKAQSTSAPGSVPEAVIASCREAEKELVRSIHSLL